MTKRYVRLIAAALALALPMTLTSFAAATPPTQRGDHSLPRKSGLTVASITPAAVIGAVPLPASPFSDQVVGTSETQGWDVFSFVLQEGEVLKATIISADGSGLAAFGLLDPANIDPHPSDAMWSAYAAGGELPLDIYIPAEFGAGTYSVGILNLNDSAVEYDVSWEILTGRSETTAERVSGPDRYAVAVNVGRKAFPGWVGVTDVIVASGDDRAMADALSASGLAGAWGAPILLAKPTLFNGKLPSATEYSLAAIRDANGGKVNIHVIGGTTSIPPAVYSRIVSFRGAGTHERLSGSDRYSLSAAMAKKARDVIVSKGGSVTDVLIANGETPGVFYDALAASPIAYSQGMPMMLSRAGSVPTSVKRQLDTTFKNTNRHLVNNSTYLKSAVRTSVAQNASNTPYNIVYPGRYSRADSTWAIALWADMHHYLDRSTIAVANKLPDALTGGVAMGEIGGPIFYTDTKAYPYLTDLYLYWNKGSITTAYVLGGPVSVPEAMMNEVNSSLEWPWVY